MNWRIQRMQEHYEQHLSSVDNVFRKLKPGRRIFIGTGCAEPQFLVKNLANQTAKATEEIGGQISGIQDATEDSVQAIQGITKTIGEINEISTAIAAAVEEQGAATAEIARNVEQASAGTSEVTSNISGVNQAADDTGKAASEVLSAVGTLTEQSDNLTHQVQSFIRE